MDLNRFKFIDIFNSSLTLHKFLLPISTNLPFLWSDLNVDYNLLYLFAFTRRKFVHQNQILKRFKLTEQSLTLMVQ